MKVECPHCKTLFKCPEEYEGRKVKCKKCNESFIAKSYLSEKAELPKLPTKESDNKPKEKIIAQIGQKYLTSIAVGAGFSSTSLTLTENSLKGAGTSYSIKHKSSISFCGDVKNLTSIGIRYYSYWLLLLIDIVLLPVALINEAIIIGIIGAVLLFLYYFVKDRYIEINFQGVVYSLSMRGISDKEAGIFIDKALAAAEEKRVKEGK